MLCIPILIHVEPIILNLSLVLDGLTGDTHALSPRVVSGATEVSIVRGCFVLIPSKEDARLLHRLVLRKLATPVQIKRVAVVVDKEGALIIFRLDGSLGLLQSLLHLAHLLLHVIHFYVHPLHFAVVVLPQSVDLRF